MIRKLATLFALALCLSSVSLGAGLILTNAQEQAVETWMNSLISGGHMFPASPGPKFDIGVAIDSFYFKAGQVAETLVMSNSGYFPIMWVDDPQFSINVKYPTAWGRGSQTDLFLTYPDSAMPRYPGGPYKTFYVSRPTGDTATALYINVLYMPQPPK